jgi:hypothetical protein
MLVPCYLGKRLGLLVGKSSSGSPKWLQMRRKEKIEAKASFMFD